MLIFEGLIDLQNPYNKDSRNDIRDDLIQSPQLTGDALKIQGYYVTHIGFINLNFKMEVVG